MAIGAAGFQNVSDSPAGTFAALDGDRNGQRKVVRKPRPIASLEKSRSNRRSGMRLKPKPISSARSRSPVSSKQSPGSYAPQRASRISGVTREAQQARELLAPVYGRFAEGFDTRDLKEAKALLEELAV